MLAIVKEKPRGSARCLSRDKNVPNIQFLSHQLQETILTLVFSARLGLVGSSQAKTQILAADLPNEIAGSMQSCAVTTLLPAV